MKLRFVTGDDPTSNAIRAREGGMAPFVGFTPSHVEMLVMTEGKLGYLGAHADGGVAIRDVGYDKGSATHELVMDVGGDDAAAEKYARSKIHTPYDWGAIFDFVDFVLPFDLHQRDHLICSAFMTLTARRAGALPYRLACRAHEISPRDLLLIFSGRMAIPGA